MNYSHCYKCPYIVKDIPNVIRASWLAYDIEGKGYNKKNPKTPSTGHKMERANSTDVRKDLLSQMARTVYYSFKQTDVTAAWNTERDDPE